MAQSQRGKLKDSYAAKLVNCITCFMSNANAALQCLSIFTSEASLSVDVFSSGKSRNKIKRMGNV